MQNAKPLKLFMLLLGCKPPGRHTEQHDVFFGIAGSVKELVPQIKLFWPEAQQGIHVDAWREVTHVDGFNIRIIDKPLANKNPNTLFFINLGGYTKNIFAEQHYTMLSVQANKASAIANAKETLFYKQVNFAGAPSHIDDHYGIDVDDLYAVEDILTPSQKAIYGIQISACLGEVEADEIHLGYFKLDKLP
ncbi:uncharacterized protein DUF1543 [Mucilaginibacter gracilis]|uniref:Uncharacterized protein DUF1543 n=1 Tax=Mucilaginibacter gracilis TaxID=423350 RepID=A0A495J200_9SPHI|nr:DUF1543 domain-containing protein [Mucilaginibacter gracilis]RKR82995.1 uncharacterized protein DUF1543 [Mucilaginibacter gracilis]